MSGTIVVKEGQISGYELSALLVTGCKQEKDGLLCNRDSYIWSSLIFDLIKATKTLPENKIDEALDYAFKAYFTAQKELLAGGLDFISYLNNRHVPLKDLVIEFVDFIFKNYRDDNNGHYLSYVYDIIAFIEKAYINSNEALNNLKLKGYLEETFAPHNMISFDLIPASYFTATEKGQRLLDEIKAMPPASLPEAVVKLLSFEPIINKVNRAFFAIVEN